MLRHVAKFPRNLSTSIYLNKTSDGQKIAKLTKERKPQLDDYGIAESQMESELAANSLRKPKAFFKDISSDQSRDETLLRIDLPKISTQDHFKNIPIEFISAVEVMIVYLPKIEHLTRSAEIKQSFVGLAKFKNLYLNALTFNNPGVQILTLFNQTPTPYIEVHLDKKLHPEPIFIDCTKKGELDILKHLQRVFGKTKEQLQVEAEKAKPKTETFGPASVLNITGNFRTCMTQAEGQFPDPNNLSPHVFLDKRLYKKWYRCMDRRKDPYATETVDWEKRYES